MVPQAPVGFHQRQVHGPQLGQAPAVHRVQRPLGQLRLLERGKGLVGLLRLLALSHLHKLFALHGGRLRGQHHRRDREEAERGGGGDPSGQQLDRPRARHPLRELSGRHGLQQLGGPHRLQADGHHAVSDGLHHLAASSVGPRVRGRHGKALGQPQEAEGVGDHPASDDDRAQLRDLLHVLSHGQAALHPDPVHVAQHVLVAELSAGRGRLPRLLSKVQDPEGAGDRDAHLRALSPSAAAGGHRGVPRVLADRGGRGHRVLLVPAGHPAADRLHGETVRRRVRGLAVRAHDVDLELFRHSGGPARGVGSGDVGRYGRKL